MPSREHIKATTATVTKMLDDLPIIATIIGVRSAEHEAGASSPEEEKLMHALFAVHETWLKEKPE